MCSEILVNIIANLIYSVLVFVIFTVLYLILNRKKLLKFFGIVKTKRLLIFTSNLQVNPFGSKGKDQRSYSYQGTAIPYEESKAASRLQTLFNYFLPSQIEKPGILSKILISDIDVKIIPSPTELEIFEQSASIISIGLPAYNSISRHIEEYSKLSINSIYINYSDISKNRKEKITSSHQNFDNQWKDFQTSSTAYSYGITSGSTIKKSESGDENPDIPAIRIDNISPFTDPSIGFIQKIIDEENERSIFYIAGLSENSTAGCVNYLASQWKELEKKFGFKHPFFIILRVSKSDNKEWQVVKESKTPR